ncbi:MAG: ABC transporter permease [Gammaproteobacteria bacterium]|nr:ABC transporter permease [Gammaproteobacteria bacterium]
MSNVALKNLIALKTIVVKEVLRFSRIWLQTILPPAITMTLYFVIFGKLIGSQISKIDGFEYIEYIVPGLILMSVITNSYANVVSSFFSAKFQRHIEELLISPTPNYIILIGFVAGGVLRGLVVGSVVTIVSFVFVDLQVHSITVTLLVLILTSILFSLAGFVNAIYARSFDDVAVIPSFILTPLTYLGGVFYTVSMLPEIWQSISLANPILYMVNAFRFGLLGVSDIDVTLAFTIVILFTVALFSFCLYLLNKGVGIRT